MRRQVSPVLARHWWSSLALFHAAEIRDMYCKLENCDEMYNNNYDGLKDVSLTDFSKVAQDKCS